MEIPVNNSGIRMRNKMGKKDNKKVLYSHNCQFGLSQMHDADRASMVTLTRVFPALAFLKKSDDEKISLVNEGIVEEVLVPLAN